MLLKCVFLTANHLNCFYRAIRADCFFERSHFLITLTSSLYYLFLQKPAEQQNCSSSTWDIFKSQSVIFFVSFNFCIFLLLIVKTKTLHKNHERTVTSWKHIQKNSKALTRENDNSLISETQFTPRHILSLSKNKI